MVIVGAEEKAQLFSKIPAEGTSQVQLLTERTRESIQGMLQALFKKRRAIFAG